MNRFVLTGLFILLCFRVVPQQLIFSGYTISNGLSQSVSNCIFQDSRGFIWFGTQNGLNRFDGYTFETFTYRPDDSTSISNNWIYGIAEDREGNLWIGTKGGLNRFHIQKKYFEKINYETPFQTNVTGFVYDVRCSASGKILINTPPVLTICDPDKMEFTHYISPLPYDGSVKDCNIPLFEDREGKIWIGSTRGLACYLPEQKSFNVYTHDSTDSSTLSDNNVTSLYGDKQGFIWVGTSNGLNRLNTSNGKFDRFVHDSKNKFSISNNFIRAIGADRTGKMWIATDGGGLNRMGRDAGGNVVFDAFTTSNSGLYHSIVLSLAIDRSENLWIGTLAGINKTDLKRQKFNLYRKNETPYSVDLAGNVVASIYKSKNDIIWVGNWGQGLNLFDRKTGKVKHYSSHHKGKYYIPNDYVHTILEDTSHTMWIGTRDGLLVYQAQNGEFIRPGNMKNSPGLPDFAGLRIFRMIQSRNLDYWVATQDGLFRKKPGESSTERYHVGASPDHRISSNLVYGVLEDKSGLIWIGTTEGLDLLNPTTSVIKHFKKSEGDDNSLTDNFITALCEDDGGNIWIGTSSFVNKFSKKEGIFTYYSQEHGLPGNLIYSILKDKGNGLWFATGNGLCRFDTITGTFHAYTVEDGIQSPEFNLGASCLASDGELFFGGMNGFNSFYPDSLTANSNIPPVVITAAYKLNKGVREYLEPGSGNKIYLNYNDYSFTVEFAALEFTNPARNQYKYRLEEINDEWIDLGNRNFIAFPKLPAGEYTLMVKGSNNDGIWNEQGAGLTIHISPPWWRSNMAYAGYVLFLGVVIFIFIRQRERHHIRDRKILEEKVSERTLQIEEQKSEILKKNIELSEINAAKDKFFSIIAHDLRNPFNSIMGLTDVLLLNIGETDSEMLKKSLENIKRSSQQAHELLENLLLWARSQTGTTDFNPEWCDLNALVEESIDLVSAQASRKNIRIVNNPAGKVTLKVDPNMIRTVLRNLLTNALKFTPHDGEVIIGITENTGNCIITVRDTGIGIAPGKLETLFNVGNSHKTKGTDMEPGTGLGLILCREFVEKHGGLIEVTSETGKGSEFRVILPCHS